MAHPLSGANIGTLAAVVARAGLPSNPLKAAAIAAAALGRWPFSAAERILIEASLPRLENINPPVFILGHWRSGTTHLYNVMCKSGDWSFVPPLATGLPWDMFGIGRVFRTALESALPEHRYIDNIPVTPDSPQEDEIALANMTELSFYHGIYFPAEFDAFLRRGVFFDGCDERDVEGWRQRFVYLMRKLVKLQEGRRPLIKNPVYTARLGMLRGMFPAGKFIHIERNPYDVFQSMRNFYRKLFAEFALQPYNHIDIDETVFSVYERMMDQLASDAAGLGAPDYIELKYEDLDQDGIRSLDRIYSSLGLPGFDAARGRFENYLSSVRKFEKNRFDYSLDDARKVEARLGRFIERGGYRRPRGAV
ncbi:MAG: sulfotransferase [Parvularculaceae bacterium]|nr:sulfotransferase [Parvularculaceae bacterium]